ncbi:MAG: HEAT repeat domain-containing protein [Bacteroidota bacterium]|nr:HEAT repeat domain-containing protein [Bacteroidota bacterium]
MAGPDLVEYPMFGTLDETGRLFLFESTGDVYEESEDAIKDPRFRINMLEDLNGDGIYDKSTIYADNVGFPQGGVFYKGSLYASSAPELIKFTDTNGDGLADQREVILSGWILNVNANSLVGPFMAPDGWLYMTNAIMGFDVTTKEGERLKGETARVWRVRPDGSNLEWISAGGMNNPVELTFTEASEPIGTMTYFTDPKAGQRDALIYWTEGGVYPKPNNNITRDQLVRTGELLPVVSKYSRVSPAGISRYKNSVLGEDFKDNLFSAQFNTHRIIRHKLFRDGASFRTEDEVFFSSTHEDFHPTDVFEDADGSLMVVETGGWFIKGCPLSQVSKPELKGAIYRVRKKDAAKVDDAYGNNIKWSTINSETATLYLDDPRPFVRERAVEALVDQKEGAVPSLTELLKKSQSSDTRTKAVFALYRIGTEEALSAVRTSLDDIDLQVRIAAARSLGLARDQKAVTKLIALVGKDEPAVRRQAATALGQIGNKQSTTALLASMEDIDDRMVEHAIIWSLINLEQPALIEPGLAHSSPRIQKVALIALDQMPKTILTLKQVTPFFTSENEELNKTALWIASHHPEWSGEMVGFIRSRFRGGPLSNEEKKLFGDILVSFSGEKNMQEFMAEQLKRGSEEQKLFLMDAMAKSKIKELPQQWVLQIGNQLSDKNPQVQLKALELVRMHKINKLPEMLRQVAENENNKPNIRIEAIGVLIGQDNFFTDKQFEFLYDQLKVNNEAPLRQQAASVLAQGKLSEDQLNKVATEYLSEADAFILPRLLPLFQGAHNSQVGTALVTTLINSPSLDSFNEENVQAVFAEYPAEVKPKVDQLMMKLRNARAGRLEKLQAMESHISQGDIERGRVLYFGKAACFTCHTLGPEGGKLGPDLTSIQKDRSAHDLLEAIVYPSATFVREFETYKIKTNNKEYTGIIQEQSPDGILLGTSPQSSVRISRNEIVSMEILDISMMPQGLDNLLSRQEMADLMAFILGQDQDPETDQAILR